MDLIQVGGLLLGFGLAMKFAVSAKLRRQEAMRFLIENSPIPVYFAVDESSTCYARNRPHEWMKVKFIEDTSGEPYEGLVCTLCGVTSDGKKQFTLRGVQQLIDQKKANEEYQAFMDSLIKYRVDELERLSFSENSTSPEREAFKKGYRAHAIIEDLVKEKIKARQQEKIKKTLTLLKLDEKK